jgi:putative cell wall-binding protein
VLLAGVVLPATSSAAQSLTVARFAGTDRFETAAQIADATFTAPVPVAFIARGDTFADALAGTPAAAVDGGPVLLVQNAAIPPATAAALTALTPGKIVVLGGPTAVADSVLTALQAFSTGSVTRLAGADRYATAAAISAATFSPGVGATYIATDIGFADALAGGAAAGAAKDPILIVQQGAIPAATAQELTRLHPKSIVILGGLAAVSKAVATQLAGFTTGPVTRVAGADPYATAVAISQASFPGSAASVYLATGANFPDALAGGVAAALAPGPLLLVLAACIPPSAAARSSDWGPQTC